MSKTYTEKNRTKVSGAEAHFLSSIDDTIDNKIIY
jgi:hypothetical protein